jgi:tRNA threonylcarbamoyladenosine biosynthesis protein TsaB
VKLLAIETATRRVGCALWEQGAPLASFSLVAGQRHAEVLMPAVDQLCRQAGWSVEDIEAVAVDRGPGLFTGLRVGVATARAIAQARGLPAVGVSSLDVVAHPHRRRPGLLAAVLDARRGEVFWALYRSDGVRLEPLRAPAVAPPQAVASELAALGAGGEHLLAVGDGARRYLSELLGSGVDAGGPDEMWPSPDDVAALGCQLLPDPGAHASLPTPLYLRQADVRIGWEQVPGRVGANAAPNGMMARHRTVGA